MWALRHLSSMSQIDLADLHMLSEKGQTGPLHRGSRSLPSGRTCLLQSCRTSRLRGSLVPAVIRFLTISCDFKFVVFLYTFVSVFRYWLWSKFPLRDNRSWIELTVLGPQSMHTTALHVSAAQASCLPVGSSHTWDGIMDLLHSANAIMQNG